MKTSQIGLKPLEKTGDPFVLTRKSATGPLSFINPKTSKYLENRPPPIYLPLEDLNLEKSFKKQDLYSGFKIEKNGSIKVTDEDLKERQKGVLSEILKNLGTKILSGKKIVGLSLPVRIFEPRSQIERILDIFHLFPHYMPKASKTKDTVERIKLIISSIAGCISHNPSQLKPFNPLLGETFQGRFDEKTKIYGEHISHHPAISFFDVEGEGWRLFGQWTYNAEIGVNKFLIFNEGWINLVFEDGEKFKIMFPCIEMKGMLVGGASARAQGSIVVVQEEKGVKGVCKIGEKKKKGFKAFFSSEKSDRFSGSIFFYDKSVYKKMFDEDWLKMMKKMSDGSDLMKKICDIGGSWIEKIIFDKKVYWEMDKEEFLCKQQMFLEDSLPSDSRFREDLIWLFYGNESYSQEWKIALEAQQRVDRKNRVKIKEV